MEISDRAWMHLKHSVEQTKAEKICIILTKGEVAMFELPRGYTIKKAKESEIDDRKSDNFSS